MNVQSPSADRRDSARSAAPAKASPARRDHRVRDFGVGYGNSSGYVSNRRYASASIAPRFRFA
ncbi:hypothetical protein [Luteimonas sp. R10]|uniref:hypothetical protein n=1 Tax=Luteimonas sp. R10 TaxID=3108176 RepID=UPI003085D8AA|nr:hypothetical protein U3649_03885 [Luteimonas sp. R10]